MNQKIARMKELQIQLKAAAKAYYQEGKEIMSNYDYDKLYDELIALEQSSGIILSGSITQQVGYELLSGFSKVKHPKPMLSLDKTKDVDALQSWLNQKLGVLSWKMDGLTIVLTYENGSLKQAVTRGNGKIGEDITENAKHFYHIPLTIPYKEKLVVRGEAIIRYSSFERTNSLLEDTAKYKNPRNLCAGTVRQLDPAVTESRQVEFIAFTLVTNESFSEITETFRFLTDLGFSIVEHTSVTFDTLKDTIISWEKKMEQNDFPSDGLVLFYNDIAYGDSLGTTNKYPRNGIAFKWADETATTTVRDIEWSASRTGLLNPVAIFDSVELEGTTVSRASVHNASIVESLQLGIGDTITVYKANMIIPQIAENLTRSGASLPQTCPVCGEPVTIQQKEDVKLIFCTNETCAAKQVGKWEHFVTRDAMNVVGLSEATIERLLQKKYISSFASLYQISNFREEIEQMDGMGKRSYEKLWEAIQNSRSCTMAQVLYSLGVTNLGRDVASKLSKKYRGNFDEFFSDLSCNYAEIEGIGEEINRTIHEYFEQSKNREELKELLSYLQVESLVEEENDSSFEGLTFVITGEVHHFANRNECKAYIEGKGGKVSGSVSKNTNYLINNDKMSSSSKNKKAKELGISILSEEDLLSLS